MDVKITGCPEKGCGAPAEVVEEELWPSTNGGVLMAKVVGACGHWFLMPAWQLDLAAVYVIDEHTGERVPLT